MLALRPLHPLFAAEASGVDLRRPLTRDEIRAVDEAMDRYGVLVVRGQPLTEDEQVAMAFQFGPQDAGFRRVSTPKLRLKYNELGDISNLDETGDIAPREHRRIVSNIANQLWHSDSSFQDPPARYSMLHAVCIPERGGDTEFCDLRVAWETLDPELQAECDGYTVEHYALNSRFFLGDTAYTETQRNALPPVRRPLVKTHVGSGRKLLFIGAHATHIPELTLAEGRMLLQDLLEHATRREVVYVHKWAVGDTIIWDNRTTLHRGRRYDLSQRRELRRATTLDVEQAGA